MVRIEIIEHIVIARVVDVGSVEVAAMEKSSFSFDVQAHYENFGLKDFLQIKGLPFSKRLTTFQYFIDHLRSSGHALYQREIKGPLSHEVVVADPIGKTDQKMKMFGSNNYLELTNHPDVKKFVKESLEKYGTGAGGPPLLNGTTTLHRLLEENISAFKHQKETVLFSSGFMAQLGWMTALIESDDVVFFDEYCHASFMEGLKIVKCRKVPFRHNDMNDLERKLKHFSTVGRESWIVVEGVYSMDGDLANLPEIVAHSQYFGAHLVLDDAHGTGVMGKRGRGTVEYFNIDPNLITLHYGTFSKVFGTVGGFISCSHSLAQYLRFLSKEYMFSAALPAIVVASVLAGLEVIEKYPERIAKLHENCLYLQRQLKSIGIESSSHSAILPILVPPHVDIRKLALAFHQAGVFINSIEYPAVPQNQQRFRISVMATHTKDDIDYLVSTFLRHFPLGR